MIQPTDILNKVTNIVKHDLKQDAYRGKVKLECISKVLGLMTDDLYGQKVEQLFTYDLDQNPEACLNSLKGIEIAIEIEEQLNLSDD